MQGKLSEIGVSEMLALATAGKRTGGLMLCSGKENVEIFFSDGRIVHATCPVGDGEQAIYYPVTWEGGVFKLHADWRAPANTIHRSSEQILETVRTIRREWEAVLEIIPSGNCVFQFSKPIEEDANPITITREALRVLCKVDGHRTVKEIAELLAAPYAQTARTLFNLCKGGLVAVAAAAGEKAMPSMVENMASPELLAALVEHLTEFIGPIAPIVVRDQIRILDEFEDQFPQAKLADLIDLVGREIPEASLRNEFQSAVSKTRFQRWLQENSESKDSQP